MTQQWGNSGHFTKVGIALGLIVLCRLVIWFTYFNKLEDYFSLIAGLTFYSRNVGSNARPLLTVNRNRVHCAIETRERVSNLK